MEKLPRKRWLDQQGVGPRSLEKNWEGRSRCRLFEIHGLTACNVSGDWLHAKYLGSDLVAFGSILWLRAFVLGPGNETENMKIFDMKIFATENSRLPPRGLCGLLLLVLAGVVVRKFGRKI